MILSFTTIVQFWKMNMDLLLDKSYVNWVILRDQNLYVKCCQSLELKLYYQQGLDLSKDVLWVSLGQRVAKLWSVKLWGWSDHPRHEPELHASGSTSTIWQNFFVPLSFFPYLDLKSSQQSVVSINNSKNVLKRYDSRSE